MYTCTRGYELKIIQSLPVELQLGNSWVQVCRRMAYGNTGQVAVLRVRAGWGLVHFEREMAGKYVEHD